MTIQSEREWIIYSLRHPDSTEIRYVGFTAEGPRQRLRRHIAEASRSKKTYRHRWIHSLISGGIHPVMDILESGRGRGWVEAERRWIAHYRASGASLVNNTDGGEGALNRGTAEERRAIRQRGIATTTPEQRSAAARKGFANRTLEQRTAGIRKAQIALARRTPEQRSASAKAGQARIGFETLSLRAKRREAAYTPEQRSARIKKANASRTPEQRSEYARKANTKFTPAQRRERTIKGNSNKTPEQLKAFSSAGNRARHHGVRL